MNSSHAIDDQSSLPPAAFLDTAQRIAQITALDVLKVIEGYPLTFRGVTFWLQHYGQLDANGMAVMVEIGTLTPETELLVCKQLLGYNYVTPAGINGYYAVMPGSNLIAYGIRVDFDKTPNPAEFIFSMIRTVVEKKAQLTAVLEAEGLSLTPEASEPKGMHFIDSSRFN